MAFLVGFFLFFLVIAFTLVMGGVSRLDDKRIEQEERVTRRQRLFTRRNVPIS